MAGEGRRAAVEAALHRVVATNRVTIALVFPVVGAVLLTASAEGLLPALLSFNPLLVLAGTAVMRLPVAAGLLPLVDRRGALALLGIGAYAYGIELVGIATGLPYGEFSYGASLGPMLFDAVPAALALFFLPLVVDGYLLALRLLGDRATSRWVRVPLAVGCVVAIDLVLDPAAVALGLWSYAGTGLYGVPLSNYAGWVLSATVAVGLFEAGFDHEAVRRRAEEYPYLLDDLVSFVLLWGLVTAFYGAWLALGVALAFGVALAGLGHFDRLAWLGRQRGDPAN
jgi:putative membrane protein